MKWTEVYSDLLKDRTPQEAGTAFEPFALQYLKALPEVADGWLLKNAPGEVKQSLDLAGDYGVDAILKLKSKKYAICQFKFKVDENDRINWSGDRLANFFGENAKNVPMYIATNVKGVDANTLKRGGNNLTLVLNKDLNRFDFTKNEIKVEKLTPKPFQATAIKKIIKYFKKNKLGKYIAACGTGKTLVASEVNRLMGNKRTLVGVPSLQLVRQIKDTFISQQAKPFLIVCSEGKAMLKHGDMSQEDYQAIGHITSDVKEIRAFVKKHKDYYIFSTYQSMGLVKSGVSGELDLKIADEAHRTTSSEYAVFHKVASKKTLFMTATERLTPDNLKSTSFTGMNNEKLYGKQIHKISFAEAIKLGALVDYKIVIMLVTDKLLAEKIYQRKYVGTGVSADEYANNVAMARLLKEGEVNKCIAFFNSNKSAAAFTQRQRQLSDKDTYVASLKGSDNTTIRKDVLNALASSEKSVVANCRVLGEGVDMPSVDGVFYGDPKYSVIDIVQSSGRAMRLDRNNPNKVGKIIVPLYCSVDDNLDVKWDEGAFAPIKNVLSAMRQQDERLNDYISSVKMGKGNRSEYKSQRRIQFIGGEHLGDFKLTEEIEMGLTKRIIDGADVGRRIKNITEENLLWMIKHGRVDERIYE